MPDHDRAEPRPAAAEQTGSVVADALASGLPTTFVVTSSDGAAIPSGSAIAEARAYELRSQPNGFDRREPADVRIEVHLVAQKARVPEVEEAILRLIDVAMSDTGQSRICADFLLSWHNSHRHGAFAVSDLFSLDGALARDVATIVTHLSRCSTAVYPDAFGHGPKMQQISLRWRPSADAA